MTKQIKWDELNPTILALREKSLSTNAIAKEVGVSRVTLARHLEETLGLPVKKNGPRLSANWVDEENIQCSVCRDVKPHADYYKIRRGSKYYYSFCKECYSTKEKVRYLSKPLSWVKKTYDLGASAKARGLEFSLTPDLLESMFSTQLGLCAYTSKPISLASGGGLTGDSLSVDRFDNSKGYTPGNVLLCSARANSIKHNQSLEELLKWMPSWYESGVAALATIEGTESI